MQYSHYEHICVILLSPILHAFLSYSAVHYAASQSGMLADAKMSISLPQRKIPCHRTRKPYEIQMKITPKARIFFSSEWEPVNTLKGINTNRILYMSWPDTFHIPCVLPFDTGSQRSRALVKVEISHWLGLMIIIKQNCQVKKTNLTKYSPVTSLQCTARYVVIKGTKRKILQTAQSNVDTSNLVWPL